MGLVIMPSVVMAREAAGEAVRRGHVTPPWGLTFRKRFPYTPGDFIVLRETLVDEREVTVDEVQQTGLSLSNSAKKWAGSAPWIGADQFAPPNGCPLSSGHRASAGPAIAP